MIDTLCITYGILYNSELLLYSVAPLSPGLGGVGHQEFTCLLQLQ